MDNDTKIKNNIMRVTTIINKMAELGRLLPNITVAGVSFVCDWASPSLIVKDGQRIFGAITVQFTLPNGSKKYKVIEHGTEEWNGFIEQIPAFTLLRHINNAQHANEDLLASLRPEKDNDFLLQYSKNNNDIAHWVRCLVAEEFVTPIILRSAESSDRIYYDVVIL